MKLRYLWAAIRFCLAAACLFFSVRACREADARTRIAAVFLEDGAIDVDTAAAIREAEEQEAAPAVFCFYFERRDAALVCEAAGRTAIATETGLLGNAELLFPEAGVLNWTPAGCLVDEETAAALFGTAEAMGQSVVCGGEAYVVCGTLSSPQPVFLRQAREADGEVLGSFAIRAPGSGGASEGGIVRDSSTDTAAQFLLRHSLTGLAVDLRTPGALVWNLCLLAPFLLGISVIRWLYGVHSPGRSRAAICLILLIALLAAMRHFLRIPADLIPSRWSDFSFFGKWLDTQKKNFLLLLNSPLGGAQLSAAAALLRSAGLSMLAALFSQGLCAELSPPVPTSKPD